MNLLLELYVQFSINVNKISKKYQYLCLLDTDYIKPTEMK